MEENLTTENQSEAQDLHIYLPHKQLNLNKTGE